MDVLGAIQSRKSIRAYLSKAVPREIISEILNTALRTPSANNTQPWEITVISNDVLDRIKNENIARILSGAQPEVQLAYGGIYRQRQVELAIDLFKLMDIKREDREKRREWLLRGFRFFDAPAAIVLSCDKSICSDSLALYDIGALGQTICLAAMHYGLGTCIEEQGVAFPDIIRKHAGISDNKEIIIGIALGYPDPAFPANQIVSQRVSLDEVTTWQGF